MRRAKIMMFFLVVVLILGVGFSSYWIYTKVLTNRNDESKRQAVFLTNGQVYFGYISRVNEQIVVLKDIYYLRTQDLLQSANDVSEDKKKISIIKLGSELHGPENIMYLNRDQILFYENMKNESKINEAIAKFSAPGSNNADKSVEANK